MTITLPIPARALSPNSRAHWRRKATLTKIHRERAKLTTLTLLASRPTPAPFTSYSLTFFFKLRRARDDDNAAASCKAYRDGIADALRIDDSNLRHRDTTMAVDVKKPRLEITLHP